MSYNLTGKWAGQYTYGDEYSEKIRGKSINFYMDCSDTDGEISGTLTDEETRHIFNEPGTFTGFFEENFISFIKRYPFYTFFDENDNTIVDEERSSHEIHYSGYWQEGSFSGEWEIHDEYLDEAGIRHSYVFTGAWSMKPTE